MSAAELQGARAAVRAARSIAVLTGAGMSAESGVPTFRDAMSGLWSRFDPYQLASPEGFRADPPLVWRWYAWRRQLVSQAQPNAGHRALAQAADHFDRLVIATQNVDGLHAAAGSRSVLELHGNLMHSHCLAECGFSVAAPGALPPGEPPRCPSCGSWLRPSVVWFGEMLDPEVLAAAQEAARTCALMLVVGTSGLVQPAAGLPALARRAGAQVIVVNPQPSELDELAHWRLPLGAAVALPALFAAD